MELLSPTMDFIFKKIFGDEQNKDLLIDFLNAVLEYKTPIVNLIEKVAINLLDLLDDDVIALKLGLDIEHVRNLRKANNK
ncbi:MAG: hypothetical protein ATN31_01990 [Candidatus Epulonipiscioides saccharophilum]|nr:MAG: hypothetical protein ATN31_01990 [Epulopiscium sp. AS2M-Bin001]